MGLMKVCEVAGMNIAIYNSQSAKSYFSESKNMNSDIDTKQITSRLDRL